MADEPFTMEEVHRSLKRRGDTAPGTAGITYSMLCWGGRGDAHAESSQSFVERGGSAKSLENSHQSADPEAQGDHLLASHLTPELSGEYGREDGSQPPEVANGPPPLVALGLPSPNGCHRLPCLVSLRVETGSWDGCFTDLKKFFELAIPPAVLIALARKGVGGRLLSWLKKFFRGRGASFRFQGEVSTVHRHAKGDPQECILSSSLFSVLLEGLMDADYARGVRLLCYTDDLALVFRMGNCLK